MKFYLLGPSEHEGHFWVIIPVSDPHNEGVQTVELREDRYGFEAAYWGRRVEHLGTHFPEITEKQALVHVPRLHKLLDLMEISCE